MASEWQKGVLAVKRAAFSILIIISLLAIPAGAKEKQYNQAAKKYMSRAVNITPSAMLKFDLGDATPAPDYLDEFLRALLAQQLTEELRFEFTHSGFKWKVKW